MKLVRVSVDFAVYDNPDKTPEAFAREVQKALECADAEVLGLTVEGWRDHPLPDPVLTNDANLSAIIAWIDAARRAAKGGARASR